MNELLIAGGTVVTMNKSREILTNTDIHIRNNKIDSIEPGGNSSPTGSNKNIINAHGKVVLPGLINAHTHADCIMARGGYSQDQSLFDWLVHIIDPIRQTYTEEDLRVAIELYCHEAIRSGIYCRFGRFC